MHERNKFYYIALGLIAGVSISMAFLVWSFPGFRDPSYQQEKYQSTHNQQTGQNNPVIRPSFWETYTTPSDTYAQWAMVILALAATAISVWAVKLLRETLTETRKAVDAANETIAVTQKMGRDQLRPWVVNYGTINFYSPTQMFVNGVPHPWGIISQHQWQNTGQTPAVNCEFFNAIRVLKKGSKPVHFPVSSTKLGIGVVGPNAQSMGSEKFTVGKDAEDVLAGTHFILLYGRVVYKDAIEGGTIRISEACFRIEVNGFTKGEDKDGNKIPIPRFTAQVFGPQNTAT